MRRPQLAVHSIAGGDFTKERVEIACGTSKWNLKSITVQGRMNRLKKRGGTHRVGLVRPCGTRSARIFFLCKR